MQHTRWFAGAFGIAVFAAMQSNARADEEEQYVRVVTDEDDMERMVEVEADDGYGDIAFLEALGGYGIQFGETMYLPAGMGDWQHPIVHGFNVGGTGGIMLGEHVALIASYEYTNADSVEGGIPGVIDSIQGFIEYHTITAGLRLYAHPGFGRLRGEVSGGVVLPYETMVQVQYGPGLTQLPVPITGTGTRIDQYSVGFGAQAAIGYDFPIVGGLYFLTQIRLKLFEAENAGESTEYTNYVTDYAATPPTATTATVRYGDGGAAPSTNSVQEVRLQLGLGYGF